MHACTHTQTNILPLMQAGNQYSTNTSASVNMFTLAFMTHNQGKSLYHNLPTVHTMITGKIMS